MSLPLRRFGLTIPLLIAFAALSAHAQIRIPDDGFAPMSRFDLTFPVSALSSLSLVYLNPVQVRLGLSAQTAPAKQQQQQQQQQQIYDLALRLRFTPTAQDDVYSLDLSALVGRSTTTPCDQYSLSTCLPYQHATVSSLSDITRVHGVSLLFKLRY